MSLVKKVNLLFACAIVFSLPAGAAPKVSRLTPPSELFSSGLSEPVVARFLPGQIFDMQATIQPDDPSKAIREASFAIDGKPLKAVTTMRTCLSGCAKELASNAVIATVRAVSVASPGVH